MTVMPPVALLSGGLATRMRSLTEKTPKGLLEVAGEPFVAHQLRKCAREGIAEVVICAGYLGEMIEAFVGDGARFGVSVRYSFDGDKLMGTGGALKRALPMLGEEFIILYGDSWLDAPYPPVVEAFRRSGRSGLMTVFHNGGQWDSSNIEFSCGAIRRYDKRNRTPEMLHIDWGMGLLKAAALNAWPADTFFDLAQVYEKLLEQGDLAGFEVAQRFYEIGSIQGLEETNQILRATNLDADGSKC